VRDVWLFVLHGNFPVFWETLSNLSSRVADSKRFIEISSLIRRWKVNIDRIANTASDDVCNRGAILNELLQCRGGMLCLSDDSFSSNGVEQLFSFYAPAITALFFVCFCFYLF